MREIKFRVWDNTFKMMLSPKLVDIDFDEGKIEVTTDTLRYEEIYTDEIKDFVLMQYIGLKDKNGKEIYEGDIVKREAYIDYEKCSKVNKVEGVIEMYNYSWCIVHKEKDKRYIHPLSMEEEFCDIKELEIVGNIYENEDLII